MCLSKNYVAKYGDEVISATEITAKNRAFYGALAKGMGKFSLVTSIITTGYSANKVITYFNNGGLSNVNGWDVGDTIAGTLGIASTIFLASNPVGWGIVGVGVLVYSGISLVHGLNTN